MLPNYIDLVGHKKGNIYIKKINEQINTGTNGTNHEPLSKEWIEKRP